MMILSLDKSLQETRFLSCSLRVVTLVVPHCEMKEKPFTHMFNPGVDKTKPLGG